MQIHLASVIPETAARISRRSGVRPSLYPAEPVKLSLLFASLACALLVCGAVSSLSFHDIASVSGITGQNVYGGKDKKDYILETTGNGVAVFDYDGDGRDDVLILNGTRMQSGAKTEHSTPQLYHNDGNGHFSDVSARAGFTGEDWWQGACAGDYDNDGHTDLLLTAYGHNRPVSESR